VFWENGFKTIGAIAAADIKDILPVLLMVRLLSPSSSSPNLFLPPPLPYKKVEKEGKEEEEGIES